ncbi:MAG: NACHT domain-containing protein, partial [bacterium]|nr:NACHT domain-containing protein [bacterium]
MSTFQGIQSGKIQSGGDTKLEVHQHYGESKTSPERDDALWHSYLWNLFSKAGSLDLRGVDWKIAAQEGEDCLQLSEIYTALLTLSTEQHENMLTTQERGKERRLAALELLNRHDRLVLLGEPGSGKSTFVKFVAMCLAGAQLDESCGVNLDRLNTLPEEDEEESVEEGSQQWAHGTLVPLWVTLRDFAAKGLPDDGSPACVKHLWNFLEAQFEEVKLGAFCAVLQEQMQQDGGLLLLDGLDEVSEADACRKQIKKVVEDFADAYPNCRILVTSRTYAYQKQDWRLRKFQEAVLAPFSQQQIDRFIKRWYRHTAKLRKMDPEDAEGKGTLLQNAIIRNEKLYALAERPLLLTLMASLHAWRGGQLPEKREELYAQAAELLLERWEQQKERHSAEGRSLSGTASLGELLGLDREQLLAVLSQIAYQAHESQPELTGTADIREESLICALLKKRDGTQELPYHTLVEFLSERAGLLIPHGNEVYSFPHRTFQEYLAACYVSGQKDFPRNIVPLVRKDPNRWREVLLLAGARVAKFEVLLWGLVEALCYRNPQDESLETEDAWGALFAGQVLAEAGILKQAVPEGPEQHKIERVRQWMEAVATESPPSMTPLPAVERAKAGDLLAALGDRRAGVSLREDGLPDIAWCELPEGRFLMGSNFTKTERKQLIEKWLTDLGDEKYRDAVERIVDAEQPQHEVFVSACQMSRYPVTNAQYQAFVDDAGYTENWRSCWDDDAWAWKEEQELSAPQKQGGIFDLP